MGIDSIVRSGSDKFKAQLDDVLNKMSLDLERRLNAFPVDENGKFIGDTSSLARTARTRQDLLNIAQQAGYNDLYTSYISNQYQGISDEIISTYEKDYGPIAFSNVDRTALEMAGQYDAAEFEDVNQSAANELSRMVFQGVAGGSDRAAFIQEVRGKLEDYYKRWASTYVVTASYNFARKVERAAQDEAGITLLEYYGPDDDNTRDFCQDLLARGPMTIEEIDELDNGQTGPGTVREMGGGYNCRHRWIPAKEQPKQVEEND